MTDENKPAQENPGSNPNELGEQLLGGEAEQGGQTPETIQGFDLQEQQEEIPMATLAEGPSRLKKIGYWALAGALAASALFAGWKAYDSSRELKKSEEELKTISDKREAERIEYKNGLENLASETGSVKKEIKSFREENAAAKSAYEAELEQRKEEIKQMQEQREKEIKQMQKGLEELAKSTGDVSKSFDSKVAGLQKSLMDYSATQKAYVEEQVKKAGEAANVQTKEIYGALPKFLAEWLRKNTMTPEQIQSAPAQTQPALLPQNRAGVNDVLDNLRKDESAIARAYFSAVDNASKRDDLSDENKAVLARALYSAYLIQSNAKDAEKKDLERALIIEYKTSRGRK